MARTGRVGKRSSSALGAALLAALLVAFCAGRLRAAFAAQPGSLRAERAPARTAGGEGSSTSVDRRSALLLGGVPLLSVTIPSSQASAADAEASAAKTVVVAGATGQTGRRIVEQLSKAGGVSVIGGVRDIAKAEKALASSSLTVRGAMLEQVDAVSTKGVALKKLDVAKDNVDSIVGTIKGADALIVATGFVPGNPFEMGKEAHLVDNLGTIALVDAAKKAGVKKVVLVSSILTNARAWGQESSAGFQITNAFGGVLDEKLVAEKYLRDSGLDFTIVRPGGLKASAPSGNLVVSKEDTLNSGEVSRDLVAEVCVASIFDGKASNRVVEIIEDEQAPKLSKEKWFA